MSGVSLTAFDSSTKLSSWEGVVGVVVMDGRVRRLWKEKFLVAFEALPSEKKRIIEVISSLSKSFLPIEKQVPVCSSDL